MRLFAAAVALLSLASFASASPYRDDLVDYNINSNQNAQSPLEYSATKRSTYFASPPNWREIPFYTILLDKFADGDPTNNQVFENLWEHDHRETQLRFGGDIKGLASRLDYLQGMGIKAIWIAGTIFLNMPWQADSYSPIDFSVVDPHWGTLQDWQDFISQVHQRGMYLMLDFTVGTMGDMVAFQG